MQSKNIAVVASKLLSIVMPCKYLFMNPSTDIALATKCPISYRATEFVCGLALQSHDHLDVNPNPC